MLSKTLPVAVRRAAVAAVSCIAALGSAATAHADLVAPAGTTYSRPALINSGSTSELAAVGYGNSLMFYWNSNGSATWNPETITPSPSYRGHGAYSDPAIARGSGFTEVADEGAGHLLYVYVNPDYTNTWTPEVVAGGDYSAPSITVDSFGGTYVAFMDQNHDLEMYYNAAKTSRFTQMTVWGGNDAVVSAPSIGTIGNTGEIEVESQGPTNVLNEWYVYDGEWWPLGSVGNDASGPSDLGYGNVAYIGADDTLYVAGLYYGEGVTQIGSSYEQVTGSPAAVTTPSGTQEIAALGRTENLEYYWNGNLEQICNHGCAFSSPAIARVDDSFPNQNHSTLVAVQGPSNSLGFYYNVDGSPYWN